MKCREVLDRKLDRVPDVAKLEALLQRLLRIQPGGAAATIAAGEACRGLMWWLFDLEPARTYLRAGYVCANEGGDSEPCLAL